MENAACIYRNYVESGSYGLIRVCESESACNFVNWGAWRGFRTLWNIDRHDFLLRLEFHLSFIIAMEDKAHKAHNAPKAGKKAERKKEKKQGSTKQKGQNAKVHNLQCLT